MKFNDHWQLQGKHAFLGASKWHWINYDPDKVLISYQNWEAVERGTKLHELAANMIKFKVKAQKSKQTFNTYVNDAITMDLKPEVVLYYSDNVFGTADAIRFDERNRFLRIHDLKTGSTPAHMEQLLIYAALFCLEYHIDPMQIQIELRIYQSNQVMICNLESDANLQIEVKDIMNKIRDFDRILSEYQESERA